MPQIYWMPIKRNKTGKQLIKFQTWLFFRTDQGLTWSCKILMNAVHCIKRTYLNILLFYWYNYVDIIIDILNIITFNVWLDWVIGKSFSFCFLCVNIFQWNNSFKKVWLKVALPSWYNKAFFKFYIKCRDENYFECFDGEIRLVMHYFRTIFKEKNQ